MLWLSNLEGGEQARCCVSFWETKCRSHWVLLALLVDMIIPDIICLIISPQIPVRITCILLFLSLVVD